MPVLEIGSRSIFVQPIDRFNWARTSAIRLAGFSA